MIVSKPPFSLVMVICTYHDNKSIEMRLTANPTTPFNIIGGPTPQLPSASLVGDNKVSLVGGVRAKRLRSPYLHL